MMKMPEASPQTEKTYQSIAATFASQGVVPSAMFGMPSMKLEGKAFAGVFGDAMVFKLTGEAHARALGLVGSVLFDPSGMGRAMKEWVVVPKAHAKRWPGFARDAVDYLAAAPKKAPTKPKAKSAKPMRSAKG